MSLNPQSAIEGMLTALTDSFHANVKAALLKQLQEDLAEELEKIAEAEATRITKVVASYYHDPLQFAEILHLRLTINDRVVKE
jgi:hypothetical protein